jgi:cytochrome P450
MSLLHETSATVAVSALPWTYLAGTAAAATALVLLSKKYLASPTHKNGIPLPPGPPASWFWENPAPKQYLAHGLAKLIEQYGPVVSLRRGNYVAIIIGRMEAATEIMEKEGGSLVDRPRSIAAGEILSGGLRLVLAHAGETFRRLRRTAHTHLQPRAAATYQEIQTETAKEVIVDILNDPKRHIQHAQRYASSVILRVTYGKSSPTFNDDPEVVRIHKVLDNFQSAVTPGTYLVDRIPWLKYVPGYARKLKQFHEYERKLFRGQLNHVRNDMETGNAGPSFGKTLLEHVDDHHLTEDEMAYLAGAFFGAGSDTTASGITIMSMAAACHPEAQARVQEELDEVIGSDRAPTFEDMDMLPQLQAFLLEAIRWRPIAVLGFAHRATKDIIWRGQCIPEGATVLGCHWAISRDPEVFPDPETFNPGRWLTEDGRVRKDMHFYTYGFGRRACPGQHVANRSLYINLALLLWSFRIQQRPEAPIDLQPEGFQEVIVFHPKPFDAEFVPRIKEARLRQLMA